MKILNTFILLISLGLVFSENLDDNEPKVDNLPKFNLPSGFYDDSTIELEIIKPAPEAIIYYTLDGSIPTVNSTVYEEPLTLKDRSDEENVYSANDNVSIKYNYVPTEKVKKANVIRTIAQLPDGTLTNVVSGTYFVGLNKEKLYGNVPVISLISDPENLFDYEKGIYILGKGYDEWKSDPKNEKTESYQVQGNYSAKGKDSERPVTIEYIPASNTTAAFSHDMGIRIKGKASRNHNQKNFRLISREEYGKKNIKYELIPDNMRSDGKGIVSKYKSFVLRNGGNDFLLSKIRDNVLQDLVTNQLFETQQSDLSVVYLDGEYWGVYYVYEEYDDHYIANNYDIDSKNVVIVKSFSNLEDGTEEDYNAFREDIKFIQKNDMSIPDNYQKANNIMDIEGLSWFAAFQAFIECKDGFLYGGNLAMWRTREPDSSVPKADGKIRVMTYDIEYSTGIYENENTAYDINVFPELFNKNSAVANKNGSKLLVSLLKNEEFKSMFINHVCDIQNIIFNDKIVNSAIDEATAALLPLIDDNIKRFGFPPGAYKAGKEPAPEDHLKEKIEIFRTWIKMRKTVFLNYVADAFGFKPTIKVRVSSNNFQKGGFSINDGYEFNSKIFQQDYEGSYFGENVVYIHGKPTSGNKLKSWTVQNCKVANHKSNVLGVYPTKGCRVILNYK